MYRLFILGLLSLCLTTSCARQVVHVQQPQSKVVVVKKAPRNHKVVIVKGKRYYVWNGKYHRKIAKGYAVVKI